jgi:hypothetical protein
VPADVYGDPVVLRDFTCKADNECPAGGRCRSGVCLFAYECTTATDCPAGTRCTVNRCVRAVDQTCTTGRDCNGLLCESGACVACNDVGARACGAGLACSPNGACVDPDSFEPGSGNGGPGKVQGGAFSCAAFAGANAQGSLALLTLTVSLLWRRRTRPRAARSRLVSDEGRVS